LSERDKAKNRLLLEASRSPQFWRETRLSTKTKKKKPTAEKKAQFESASFLPPRSIDTMSNPDDIAKQFVSHYYSVFDTDRTQLAPLYVKTFFIR
jgi:hypothetical protein